MKTKNIRIWSFLLFLMIGCSKSDVPVQEVTPVGVSVKTMTYNMYAAQKKGIEAIADVIKRNDPDLVGLQEVEVNSTNQNFDTGRKLSELTGMPYYYFVKARNLDKGEYGNLILSKFPFDEKKTYELGVLTSETNAYIRALGIVKLNKEGQDFYFSVAHLDHLSDNANRLYQVDLIHQYTKDLTLPIILSTDLNAKPSEEAFKAIIKWFTPGCLNGYCGFTAGTPKPDGTIDYLMFAPADAVMTQTYDVDYSSYSQSDHFPVIANFLIKN
ncbi:endonuclease/exonuclease/phosphatase family protein [Sphingobacterium faecium]|uniref:endonuclease/exonuclease/phosphatase family protein n=1 Tax=Sphingobacterium faecium TaxID=34087 RepID=UPI0024798228|nr:endonuclease/exonuclease/phosphatase family protein [Sphingobacterium faecium]WGQ12879.1 endonuclease/exonuclease/phosphatase family protein [Sphingobacterium faecium]